MSCVATEPSRLVGDIIVLDQDEREVAVTEVHRGVGATVVHVEIDKPPQPLGPEDSVTALGAALLGFNRRTTTKQVALHMKQELDRMGYGLISKERSVK